MKNMRKTLQNYWGLDIKTFDGGLLDETAKTRTWHSKYGLTHQLAETMTTNWGLFKFPAYNIINALWKYF